MSKELFLLLILKTNNLRQAWNDFARSYRIYDIFRYVVGLLCSLCIDNIKLPMDKRVLLILAG